MCLLCYVMMRVVWEVVSKWPTVSFGLTVAYKVQLPFKQRRVIVTKPSQARPARREESQKNNSEIDFVQQQQQQNASVNVLHHVQ